ncbi:hypothetical protein H2203_002338 [Taxawa tesnikishii (nom. ined.)]|nr:hypothetical protein H2203_002338 [Dothideales sp. JES 119]
MAPLNVLMVGTGEYTTGFVGGGMSGSDKKVGVVGLTLFDLRRRGRSASCPWSALLETNSLLSVSLILLFRCLDELDRWIARSGGPEDGEHLNKNITQVYNNLDTSFDSFPENDKRDPEAYKTAIDALSLAMPSPSSLLTPPTSPLPCTPSSDHLTLLEESRKHGVFVYIEHHKRFDPAYSDARAKAKNLGDFNYFYSYMSQPKSQLETFKAWAGKDSDISYYLNSHHIDVNESMVPSYRPTKVTASASTGIATDLGCDPKTEDTITLVVDWEKKDGSGRRATGVYTSSWTAPQKAGVHSNQYFHYMASKGEVRVNQAKRGYDVAEDDQGQLMWYNPFYMKYAPDESGNFAGQGGYGYVSFEKFVDAIADLKDGKVTLDELDKRGLPTLKNTIATGAILEAGRRSLDEKRSVEIVEKDGEWSLK